MTNHIVYKSQLKAAKVAGLAYLLIIVTSILSMIFGPFKLIVKGDNAATFNNFRNNILLLFEIAIGIWLLFKGIKLPEMKS